MHVASGRRGWAGFGGRPCILYFHRIPSSSANSLRKTHSHCSTLQEGCTQLTARLSVISLDVPYSWVHAKVTLAQRNYGMFKFVAGEHRYAHVHIGTIARHRLYVTERRSPVENEALCKRSTLS